MSSNSRSARGGTPALISALDARRLFLGAQGLLDDPGRPATRLELRRSITRLGFVQLDSINVLERAHHLTLWTRLHGYRHAHLRRLLEHDRSLFEHWTHDASVVPIRWYSHWKHRFVRDRARMLASTWWRGRAGADVDSLLAHVLERIDREGPLRSADFAHEQASGGWWEWKPQKAALEFLWRTGELAVTRREHFHKVYDLSARVLPEAHVVPASSPAAHLAWACASAARRLLVFTPRELAAFWHAIGVAEARGWCDAATKRGELVPVLVGSADGSRPAPAFAVSDWKQRLAALTDPPPGMRLLCPFDPVLRDRQRALRLFGFDYRFEAFVPEEQRKYGYFVLPILEGDRLVGRLDPKLHRARSLLEIKGIWWEPGVAPTRQRKRQAEAAVDALAGFVGAKEFSLPSGREGTAR
jgi:uncharacterized protein